jgi:hypothetical protein
MTKYLLTCGCGATLPVDVGQAGDRISCQCGAIVEVPPLRKLRHQPAATAPTTESIAWNARRGIVAALAILAGVLVLIALWSRVTEPTIAKFDPGIRTQGVEEGLKGMTPLRGWQLWIEVYRPLAERGFFEFVDPHAPVIEQQIAKKRFLQWTLLVAAAVCAALAGVVALWPREISRQGDKATRRSR